MAEHNDLGETGELEAQNYLRTKGYKIRDVKWTSGKT